MKSRVGQILACVPVVFLQDSSDDWHRKNMESYRTQHHWRANAYVKVYSIDMIDVYHVNGSFCWKVHACIKQNFWIESGVTLCCVEWKSSQTIHHYITNDHTSQLKVFDKVWPLVVTPQITPVIRFRPTPII